MYLRDARAVARILLTLAVIAAADALPAQQKVSLPDEAAVAAAQQAANDFFGDRFRSAKTAADKTALAAEMIEAAMKLQAGSADQYVLLRIARQIATAAGDAVTALDAAEKEAERFDVPAAKLKGDTLLAVAEKAASTALHKAVAEASVQLVDGLTEAGEIELALKVCEAGRAAAQRSREFASAKKLSSKADELKKLHASLEEYRRSMAILENDPVEPAANLAAGRYLCFVLGDWDHGVSMLALGSDSALREAAILELRNADSEEQQAAIGDGWWDAAETRKGAERDALRVRAGFWYQQAAPKLAGALAGLRIKQRLDEVEKLRATGSAVAERTAPTKEQSSRPHLVFQFNERAFAEKYWEWSGEWDMTEEGGKAPRGNPDKSFLRSRHGYLSDVVIDMDFSLDRAKYSNHGDCWITMWGKQLIISMNWPALTAKIHIHREGNEIVYVLNGQQQRIAVEPQVGAQPTTIDLHWRSRESHFRRIEIKADRMVPVNPYSAKPARS